MITNTFLRRLFSISAAAIVIGCVHVNAGDVVTPVQSDPTARRLLDADSVADFRRRADEYMKLHEKIQKQGARQTTAAGIGENLVSREALATRLRFARHDARPGDIFTPRIARALRRAIDPEIRGLTTLNVREAIRDDAPGTFVLVVNGDYPDGASRSTMPAVLLQILPSLPKGLDYRIVDTHLLLMDLDANIVVDYMLDVMCKTC
jgi:hypothetical protein